MYNYIKNNKIEVERMLNIVGWLLTKSLFKQGAIKYIRVRDGNMNEIP